MDANRCTVSGYRFSIPMINAAWALGFALGELAGGSRYSTAWVRIVTTQVAYMASLVPSQPATPSATSLILSASLSMLKGFEMICMPFSRKSPLAAISA